MSVEREDHISASISVPRLQQDFPVGNRCIQRGTGSGCCHKNRDDGCYHPVAFGSRTLTPSEQNYHSSKLEFLALKWSITKHFKEYLAYAPFTVCTDNNPLTYMLTTPNLDATRHH